MDLINRLAQGISALIIAELLQPVDNSITHHPNHCICQYVQTLAETSNISATSSAEPPYKRFRPAETNTKPQDWLKVYSGPLSDPCTYLAKLSEHMGIFLEPRLLPDCIMVSINESTEPPIYTVYLKASPKIIEELQKIISCFS